MIVSASRRTDLPAFYGAWLCRRFEEGFVLVRNPVNRNAVSRIILSPETVEGIVFWTKNPLPFLHRLSLFSQYPYYFECTLTPYGRDIEPFLPDKKNVLIPAIRKLSSLIGPRRVVWRYDPILLSPVCTAAFHRRAFSEMAEALRGATLRCAVSFLDLYQHIRPAMARLRAAPPTDEEKRRLLSSFAESAARNGMELVLCAEPLDTTGLPVRRAPCIDKTLFESITGIPFKDEKDRNQRPLCRCMPSVDIGDYSTCPFGCRYCYAARRPVAKAISCDPENPLLTGHLSPDDVVKDRPMPSLRAIEESLF